MTTYGYARVSTARQASEGESLDVQQRQIEGYCLQHDLVLAGVVVEEGVSGSIALVDRPRAAELLSALRPGDSIVAAKLDRMFRSALDALQTVQVMKEKGVRIHLLDLGGDIAGNGLSKLFLTIAAAFAEAERDRIRERVQVVKRDQKLRGKYLGGKIPFGWTKDDEDNMILVPEQQAALVDMAAWRKDGMPYRNISAAIASAHGLKISHTSVKRILDRQQA